MLIFRILFILNDVDRYTTNFRITFYFGKYHPVRLKNPKRAFFGTPCTLTQKLRDSVILVKFFLTNSFSTNFGKYSYLFL